MTTPEFNRLTKTSFNERMKEAEMSLISKTEVKNMLDLGDENRKTKRYFNCLNQVISILRIEKIQR